MGRNPRGKGRGNQRGSRGEGGRGGKVWRHAESLPTRPRAGPLGAMSRVEGLRKPWGGLEGGFQAGVRRSKRPEENPQTERQTVQSPIK